METTNRTFDFSASPSEEDRITSPKSSSNPLAERTRSKIDTSLLRITIPDSPETTNNSKKFFKERGEEDSPDLGKRVKTLLLVNKKPHDSFTITQDKIYSSAEFITSASVTIDRGVTVKIHSCYALEKVEFILMPGAKLEISILSSYKNFAVTTKPPESSMVEYKEKEFGRSEIPDSTELFIIHSGWHPIAEFRTEVQSIFALGPHAKILFQNSYDITSGLEFHGCSANILGDTTHEAEASSGLY
jgi:hypothetical protein